MLEDGTSPSWADFADRTGARFTMEVDGGPLDLVLEQAALLSQSARPGGSFRLAFRGLHDQVQPQATYRIQGDGLDLEVFLVPIGQDNRGTLYEAIFN